MTPIYASSTYVQQSPGVHKGYDYSRSGNPTRAALEACIADLENGAQGFAFASGLAAEATILELLDSGDHVIAGDDLYGGTYRLFADVRRRSAGLSSAMWISATSPRWRRPSGRRPACCGSRPRPIRCSRWPTSRRSPSLPGAAASSRCATTPLPAPWVQRPLDHGIDIVFHSATKYLNGHSDVVQAWRWSRRETRHDDLAERLGYLQNAVGGVLGPFDAFFVLRSLKTLPIRMERHCANAMAVAEWLERHPGIAQVWYPGLKSHRQHDLAGGRCTASAAWSRRSSTGGWSRPGGFSSAAKCLPLPRASAGSKA
jgi:cystathionine gamma-lyase